MTLQDRALREQTLFALYENPPLTTTEEGLRDGLEKAINNVYASKGAWTRTKMLSVSKSIAEQLNIPFEKLQENVFKDVKLQVKASTLFKLDPSFLEKLTDPNTLTQGYSVKDLFKVTQDNAVRQVQVAFTSAAARGLGPNEIVSEMQAKLDALTKSQLKSAVITVQNEARAKVRHENYVQMEEEGLITGYTYDATLDGRTTPYCQEHDGKTYWKPISEISSLINTHFRCRSVFAPAVKDPKVRASVFGPTEHQTYKQWFKTQDNDFQQVVLGAKRFKAYQAGTYKVEGLADLVGVTVPLAAVEDLLYYPSVKESGDLSDNSARLLGAQLSREAAYPIRERVEELRVDVREAGAYLSSLQGKGLAIETRVEGKIATLHYWELPEDMRWQGLGREILRKTEQFLIKAGVTTLKANAAKPGAIMIWFKLGFRPESISSFKSRLLLLFKEDYPEYLDRISTRPNWLDLLLQDDEMVSILDVELRNDKMLLTKPLVL